MRKLMQNQKVNYLIVGGLNTFIALTIFFILEKILNQVHYLAILVISHIISVFISHHNFYYFVFYAKNVNYWRSYLKANLVYISNLLLNSLLLTVFVELLMLKIFYSQILSVIIIAVLTYFLHKNYTFKNKI
jgi:putative flippase GtrA